MIINPINFELLGKELHRDRLSEAENEHLVNLATGRTPIRPGRKVLLILSSNWRAFWNRILRNSDHIPISGTPEKTLSM